MANTYTQIYVMLVFGPKGRKKVIDPQYEKELFKYITGIIKNKDQQILQINGTWDHIHILVAIKPNKSVSALVRDIKSNSSKFINEKGWFVQKFAWQRGFGAFSYAQSQIDDVVRYIKDQKNHHKKISFENEYKKLLDVYNIKYESKFLFD